LPARKAELQLSNATLEELVGLCQGHLDKVIGPSRTRGMSLHVMLVLVGALGLAVQRPDPNAKVARWWERRDHRRVHDNGLVWSARKPSGRLDRSSWPSWPGKPVPRAGQASPQRNEPQLSTS
jgi:hypothetical protein